MKILLVSNQGRNKDGVGNPIMYRMVNAIRKDPRVKDVEFFHVNNSLDGYRNLRKKAKYFDLVHVHFGGIYALIIWLSLIGIKVKKFITFHGTDIHAKAIKTTRNKISKVKIRLNQKASFLSLRLFDKCGFVANDLKDYVPRTLKLLVEKKSFIQQLGVDYDVFSIIDKTEALHHLEIPEANYILFSDVSNTPIKRRDLAEQISKELSNEYKLLIMSKVEPDEVPYYINACDFAILTSDEEGSPNIIREVLSLNKPFFSVNVGDAAEQLSGLNNSKIISREPAIAANQIKQTLKKPYTDDTRNHLRQRLDFAAVSKGVIDIYFDVLNS